MIFKYSAFLLLITLNWVSSQNCNGPPPFHINPQSCCNHPKVVDDQIFMKCFSDFRETRLQKRQSGFPGGHHGPQSPQNCIGECVFKSVKVWNDGDIDLEASKNFFTSGLKDTPEWVPIVAKGFEKCSTEAKTIASIIRNSQGDCSPIPALTLACLHTHVITNCPAKLWNSTPQCNELQSYFANCPTTPKH